MNSFMIYYIIGMAKIVWLPSLSSDANTIHINAMSILLVDDLCTVTLKQSFITVIK